MRYSSGDRDEREDTAEVIWFSSDFLQCLLIPDKMQDGNKKHNDEALNRIGVDYNEKHTKAATAHGRAAARRAPEGIQAPHR